MSRFNPLDNPICLTYPKRIAASAWLAHVPFAMFLIDALRPRTLVELGSYNGASYCAFCQAVKELGTDTRCYAIDTWEGDHQGGFYGPEVLADLKRHHDPLYGHFSQLITSTFEDAVSQFSDTSIDLLHIDGLHTYEAVKHDFEHWKPKMSNCGLVLFHDIAVKEDGFGVWKFWEEITPHYPHFEMMYGYGLGILAVGEAYPEAVQALLQASEEDVRKIRDLFLHLAIGVEHYVHDKLTIAHQDRQIATLESTIARYHSHPFFKIYHGVRRLGRR